MGFIQGYNHEKYWRRREVVTNPNDRTALFIKLYYLYYIKKTDARWNCSFGTSLGSGAKFKSPPHLPHGPNGIIIGHHVEVGSGCTIYQHVTVTSGHVKIGDNCLIGAGAVVLPSVIIGDDCRIGANAVVVEDMPDNSTCVMAKPRIIVRNDYK